MPLRVKNWENFENSRSRSVERLSWVAVPNSHDGGGFALVMAHPRAAEIYAAWILMLQVASRCKPRGVLASADGTPYTAKILAMKTRARPEWFELAIEVLTSPEIGWLEDTPPQKLTPECQPGDSRVIPNCQEGDSRVSGNCQAGDTRVIPNCQPGDTQVTGDCQAGDTQLSLQGGEGKEGKKGVEGDGARRKAPPTRPPTIEEVIEHAKSVGMTPEDARHFFDYYNARDWVRSKGQPIKDWRRALANWFANTHRYGSVAKSPIPAGLSPEERERHLLEAAL